MTNTCGAVRSIVGGILIHLTLGTLYTFGNLSPYMTSYIRKHSTPSNLTYGQSVWINALASMGQGITMYFGGILEKRLSPRLSVLIGAWFQSLGILLTYFAIQYSFVATIFTYGMMFGFGIGVAYAVPLAVGMRWLPERAGLVNGFVVAGFGGGAFIFNQVQTAYINPNNLSPDLDEDGEKYFTQDEVLDKVPSMFLILGGTYAAMQLIGCLLLSNPPHHTEVSYLPLVSSLEDEEKQAEAIGDDSDTETSNIANNTDPHAQLLHSNVQEDPAIPPMEVLKKLAFYLLWSIFLLNGQGVMFISSLYKAYGQTFISDDVFLAWVGTFAAICNAGGRIMWGSLADRFSFKVAMLCMCCVFCVAMLTLGVTSLVGRWMFLVWVGLLFLGFSGNFSLMPTATARCFGKTHVTRNYGLLFTSQVITSAVGAVLTSSLKSAIGWYGMFYLVAGFSFISFLLTILFNEKKADGTDV